MKINHLIFTAAIVFMVVMGAASIGFYQAERKAVLGYISNGIQQSVYRLEESVKIPLKSGHENDLQAILDRASAIDMAIKEIALSTDSRIIGYSSQRSEIGNPLVKKYMQMATVTEALLNNKSLYYQSEFDYFDGVHTKHVLILVTIDQDYVYGQLSRLGWLFGVGLLSLSIGLVFLVLISVRRFFLDPLEKIMAMVKNKVREPNSYFIQEFSLLSQTIAMTFRSMWVQNEKLKESLEESQYLDGILRTVADVNGYLISSQSVGELSQKCCERLSAHTGYGICWIGIFTDDELEVVGCTDENNELLHLGLTINLKHSEELFAYAPSIQAYAEDKIVTMNHLEDNESLAPWSFIAREEHDGSFIALPLRARVGERPFGVLSLYGTENDGFMDKEIQMLDELAGDIGFAIHSYTQRDQLLHHMQIDIVTGLANRISLIDALSGKKMCALAILNIDRFTDINDVYGVHIGDQVLAGYGSWLAKKIEKSPGVSLYKLGSDEYALLFGENIETEDAIALLEYLIDKTAEESFVVEGIEIVLTISVGFDPKSDKVLENATRALKQAKLEHGSLVVYTPVLGAKKEQAQNIEWYKEIKEALREDRIVPYFQPIVDNKTQKIVRYEALVRLIKSDGTVVPPFHFLEIAKKIRLYPFLTEVMVDKVLERFEGLEMKVSINLSNEDILNTKLADYIEETILKRKIGRFVIFEILESEGITNYNEVSTFIERFRCLGCSFAIDDFGSGYSNFDHILKLNIDTLKIDGSLIKNLPHDHNSQIIVRHICEFAREMGMSTVAEFVANEAIYQKVIELGIDASQGFHFYEPSESIYP
ncbi:MAG TPA: GGDEF domain-containing protein [Sulfuricurvum sp.]|nr:GGDEF domain-containing protein [Sulfuricurvum sp.]